jgi:MerR family transcriptional regulator, copper efflux regulator
MDVIPISPPAQDAAAPGSERWRTAPVACSLTGDDQASRAAAWRAALDGASRASLPDGLRLTVPAGRAAVIAGLAAAEQACCPFFDFRLHLDSPVLHLDVRAAAGAADLLEALFAQA